MNARTIPVLISGVAMAATLAFAPTASAQSSLARCRADIAGALRGGMQESEKAFARCLKTRQGCSRIFFSPVTGEEFSLAIQGVDSACVAASVLGGIAVDDLALAECPAAWRGCGPIANTTLFQVDDCETCLSIGLNAKLAFDLDFPSQITTLSDAPESQRDCIGGLYRALSRAARRGLDDATRCALKAGDPPWSCSTEPQPDSKLARMLTRIDRAATRCEGALAEPDSVVATLCNGPIASSSDLAGCARRAAVCRACQAANFALGLGQDCVAQSGDRFCNESFGPDYGRPDPGSVFVTNEGDGSITLYEPDLSYSYGSLAASSFAVGNGPVDVAINPHLSLAYVVNRTDATMTAIEARTGEPAFGDLASSTFPVGSLPSAVAVHTGYGIVYVANEGDGTITMFDGSDGTYLNGTRAASSFPTGRAPSSIAVNERDDVLYVANADDDTVTFLRASDGQPYFADLASSTFPVGDEPVDISHFADSGVLVVTNHGDGTVTTLDSATGDPEYGTLAASTRFVGAGPVASAYEWYGVYTGLDEGSGVSGWLDYVLETAYGPVQSETVTTDGPVSDVLLSSGTLLSTVRSTDELGEMRVAQYNSLLGVTAADDATVHINGYGAEDLAVDPSTGDFLAPGYFEGDSDAAFAVLDPATETVTYRGHLTRADRIAYNPAAGIVFVASPSYYTGEIVLLDGATGAYRNGTQAASTVGPLCSASIDTMVYAPASNTLLVRCARKVIYLDGTTGAYRTGSEATSTLTLEGYDGAIVLDEAGDRAFVEDYDYPDSYVVTLTISSVGFTGGTLAASKIITNSGGLGLAIDPAAGILYRANVNGQVTLHDLSGALLATAALPATYVDNIEIAVNPANGILYVSRSDVSRAGVNIGIDDIVYLDASDGSYVGTNLEDSSVVVGDHAGVLAARISQATATIGVPVQSWDNGYGVLLLDADEPVAKGERKAFRRTVPTGASPSSVAMMPWYF